MSFLELANHNELKKCDVYQFQQMFINFQKIADAIKIVLGQSQERTFRTPE